MGKKLIQQKYLVEFEVTVQIDEIEQSDNMEDVYQHELQKFLLSDTKATEALLHSELKTALSDFAESFSSNTDQDHINSQKAIEWAITQLPKDNDAKRFFNEAIKNGYLSEATELIWYTNLTSEVNSFNTSKLVDS